MAEYLLPYLDDDWVLLTPKDILTKDDTWINKVDLINDYDFVILSIPDTQLRAQLNNYLIKQLPRKATPDDRKNAIQKVIIDNPEFIEYFIRYKEENGDDAESISHKNVQEIQAIFDTQVRQIVEKLSSETKFYSISGNTKQEAKERVTYLKDVIENKGGHKLFYYNGQPIRRESDLHILYRLTWCATISDISAEVNDGRGPADFKASRGRFDKTIIEFKLASNSQLERNLQSQVDIYKKASDAKHGIKVIIYFSRAELERVNVY